MNEEAFEELGYVLDNADKGFFVVVGMPDTQCDAARPYASRSAVYNFSDTGEQKNFSEMQLWARRQDSGKALFILNLQVMLVEDIDLQNFNLIRDVLARMDRVWVFGMTAELEERLFLLAPDFYSYVRVKIVFNNAPHKKPEPFEFPYYFTPVEPVEEARNAILAYKPTEEKLMSFEWENAPKEQQSSVAQILSNIAEVYYNQGKYKKALELYNKVLLIRGPVFGTAQLDTGEVYNNIGNIYYMQGEYQKALDFYSKNLSYCSTDSPIYTAQVYNNIATVYGEMGKYEESLDYYSKAVNIKKSILGEESPNTLDTYSNIASVYCKQGDYEKALELNIKVLTTRERVLGKKHLDTADSYHNTANVYARQGNYKKALDLYNKALMIEETVLGKEHDIVASSYNSIGVAYYGQGDYEKALAFYNKGLTIAENTLGENHPETATLYDNIALISYEQGKYQESLPLFLKAHKILAAKLGEQHSLTIKNKKNIISAYNKTNPVISFDEWLSKNL
ncbi:hypothetical protein FACS1894188_02900 [Clostridia bacterium]|nr:hypothetical protein FACS1894188_02900 [Clostridia bacterium]